MTAPQDAARRSPSNGETAPGFQRGPDPGSDRLFQACAALALLLHVVLVFGRTGLWGGGDLVPHLRLIQATSLHALVHNPYAPAYHVLGALLGPIVGLDFYPKLFAIGAAALLIAGFRSFQRAAQLPSASSAIFCLTPTLLSLSWCTPRIEAAGYGVLLFGLGRLLRGQRVALALLVALAFYVHTASALLFGIAAGVLALARRDAGALLALFVGSLGALPLIATHLGAGCSIPEAFLFARGGYARSLSESLLPGRWPWLVPLAGPVALGAAALGARELWRTQRSLAVLCAVLLALYLTNVWLAPFGVRTLVTLLRGLTVLAIPVAVAAGVFAARNRGSLLGILGTTAAWAVFACPWVVPKACFVRPIALAEVGQVGIGRCQFTWRPGRERAAHPLRTKPERAPPVDRGS